VTPLPPIAAAAPAAAEKAPPQKSASIAPITRTAPPPVQQVAPPPVEQPAPPPADVAPAPAPPPPAEVATGPTVAMQPGTHLLDGDFISEEENFEWGVVQVKLSLHAGAITNVAILQMPDHRSRSRELSEVSAPILTRETIQTQKAQVDVVSEATYTSMAYEDAVANALMKATR
jgi:uncharacterized protein with FMN-binding domain